jgi:hypothetical protein
MEKTFKEWLKENPEIEEEVKKYEYKIVNNPPKFCWGLNLNTTSEEAWKLYKEGKINIRPLKVEKQLTPYGQKKLRKEGRIKELIEEIKDQVLRSKKG